MWLCRVAQTSAAVLLAGTVALRLLAGGGVASGTAPRWNRLAVACWFALLFAAVVQLGLTTAQMSDLPLGQILHGDALAGILSWTHFGAVWKVRIGLIAGLLVTGLLGVAAERNANPRLNAIADVAAALLVVSLLASLVATGHAQASEKSDWLLPVDMIHAAAAGAWPGGLLPLVLLLAQARRKTQWLAPAITITRRFSRLSVVAVGVLAMSGSLNSYALIGTFAGLWASVYGRLVVCKGLLFVTMVALGAMNKRLIEQEPMENARATVSRLWRNVAVECAVAAALLLATEALAMSTPTASAVAFGDGGRLHLLIPQGEISVLCARVRVRPRLGHVTLRSTWSISWLTRRAE